MSLPSQRSRGTSDGRSAHPNARAGGIGKSIATVVVVLLFIGAVWGGIEWIGKTKPAPAGAVEPGTLSDAGPIREPTPGAGGLLSEAVSHAQNPDTDETAAPGLPEDIARVGPETDIVAEVPERTELVIPSPPTDDHGAVAGAPDGDESRSLEALTSTVQTSRTPGRSAPRRTEIADREIAENDPLAARLILLEGLEDRDASEIERSMIRARLSDLNETLVFGPRIYDGDPLVERYDIQSGDSLSRIARRRELAVHWKLIQRVNGMSDPNKIRAGQPIKLVRGPFHAVVHKADYRLDLYHGAPSRREDWMYVRSFRVGLGRDDGTPPGTFVIKRNSKVENPSWTNPRDGSEVYRRNDPKNPIGEFWLGLEGIGADARYVGYGIHGTIEPDSIGHQESLGCVRLIDEDIAILYELLVEGVSTVVIED